LLLTKVQNHVLALKLYVLFIDDSRLPSVGFLRRGRFIILFIA